MVDEDTPATTTEPASYTAAPPKSTFQIRRVLYVVLPALLIFGGAVYVLAVSDVQEQVAEWFRPGFAKAHGNVTWKGKPLPNAQVTFVSKAGYPPAQGMTDGYGKFFMQTDIRGHKTMGAYIGEHTVTIIAYRIGASPTPGTRTTPKPLSQAETSPLHIKVDADAAKNDFKFEI